MSRVGLTSKIAQSLTSAETQEEKLEILQKYQKETLIKRIVNFAYNPLITFDLNDYSPTNKGKQYGMGISKFMHVIEDINEGKYTREEAMFASNLVLQHISDDESNIFVGILKKNLGWGLEAKTISEVWPDLNVGYPIQYPMDFSPKIFQTFDNVCAVQKLYTGVRINVIVRGKGIRIVDEFGEDFDHLNQYHEQFANLAQHGDTIFDGAMMIVDSNNNIIEVEDQQEIIDADPNTVKFILWDAIRYDGFVNGTDTRIGYNWRYNGLEHMMFLAVEHNPYPCYTLPESKACADIAQIKQFQNDIDCDVVIKNLSGTWQSGTTTSELILRK